MQLTTSRVNAAIQTSVNLSLSAWSGLSYLSQAKRVLDLVALLRRNAHLVRIVPPACDNRPDFFNDCFGPAALRRYCELIVGFFAACTSVYKMPLPRVLSRVFTYRTLRRAPTYC